MRVEFKKGVVWNGVKYKKGDQINCSRREYEELVMIGVVNGRHEIKDGPLPVDEEE